MNIEPKNILLSNQRYSFTKERYEGIKQFRKIFFETANENAHNCPFLRSEVAESWNRCRDLKINHQKIEYKNLLSPNEYNRIVKHNQNLIKITNPLFSAFHELNALNGSALFLCDRNNVLLLRHTEKTSNPFPHRNLILDERNIGTSANALCVIHKKPIQLLGLEYYNDGFAKYDTINSAAPIMGKDGNVLGSITIRQDIPYSLLDHNNFQVTFIHTLALTYAMAATIENGLKLQSSYDILESASKRLRATRDSLLISNETLKASWSLMDEGMALIDQNGEIFYINKKGSEILNINPASTMNRNIRNIRNYLVQSSTLIQMVDKGENIDIEDIIRIGNHEKKYLISVRPVLINEKNSNTKNAVLRITPIEKINALVNRISGASASFYFKDIVGESKIFTAALKAAKNFSSIHENILLIGESGTGKELFAQAIHNDHNPKGPFIAINCAAIPRNLIESELLGYEGGSFTGAERKGRPGKIELANGGTLFLDEIGDMPFELQAVLLRVLEDKKIMRLGGHYYNKVNFKLIAATNKDLYQMVKDGVFREDLYYRLSVLTIKIPALRERGSDTEVLSRYFIESYCRKIGRAIPRLNAATLKTIKKFNWPGNVRQLENALIYAVNVTTGSTITPNNLPGYIEDKIEEDFPKTEKILKLSPLKDSERNTIQAAIIESRNNIATAAKMLKISKPTMYRKMKKFGIECQKNWGVGI